MTSDLVTDFNDVLEVIPDNAENIMQEKARQERLDKYTHDLIAYAKGEIKELDIPETVLLRSEGEINGEIERMKKNPTRLDKILVINEFILTNVDVIRETGIPVSQLLYNSTDNGPLSYIFSERKNILPSVTWIQLENRPKFSINFLISTFWIPPLSEFSLKTSCNFKQTVLIIAGGLMVFETKKTSVPKILNYAGVPIDCFSITQDGTYVISAHHDTIIVWNTLEIKIVKQFIISDIRNNIIDNEDILDLSVNHDATKIVLFSRKKNTNNLGLEKYCFIRVFDKDGLLIGKYSKLLNELCDNETICTNLERNIISFIDRRTLWLWDLVNDNCIVLLSCWNNDFFISHTANHNYSHIIISSINGNLYIVKIENGEVETIFNTHKGGPSVVSISADATMAAIGDCEGNIHIWNLKNHTLLKSFKAYSSAIVSLVLASDGSKVLTTAVNSNEMKIWDISRGYQLEKDPIDEKLRWDPSSNCGKRNAIANSLYNLHQILGESIKWKYLSNLLHPPSPLDEIHLVTQDETTAIGEQQIGRQVVGKLNIKTNQVNLCENIPFFEKNCIDISQDGRYVYIGEGHDLYRWDIETNSCISLIKDPDYIFRLIKLSPDGKLVATSDLRHTPIRLWDLCTGLWKTPGGPIDEPNELHFMPDGRGIVGDYQYNMFTIWEIKNSTIRVNEPHVMSQDEGTINIWPDGRLIIKTFNRLLSIYAINGNRVANYYSNRGAIIHSEFCGNGFILFIEDGSIEIITIENPPIYGPAIVTAVRLWRFGDSSSRGKWDNKLTTLCGWCSNRIIVTESVIGAIKDGLKEYDYSKENFENFNYPDNIWNSPNLVQECPSCQMPLKFNPFIVDNRDKLEE